MTAATNLSCVSHSADDMLDDESKRKAKLAGCGHALSPMHMKQMSSSSAIAIAEVTA
jgi:hypothetical protein